MLQCVLQCVAECDDLLQSVVSVTGLAVCCHVCQCVTACCSLLQSVESVAVSENGIRS